MAFQGNRDEVGSRNGSEKEEGKINLAYEFEIYRANKDLKNVTASGSARLHTPHIITITDLG